MEKKSASVGRQIGNYRISGEIGSGGFGNIYLAKHVLVQGRPVVIKLLRDVHLSSEEERKGFIQEAQILENLKGHPHILPIVDVGIDGGVPYLITAYAEQGSLRDRLKRRNYLPFPLPDALTIIQQVGEALQYAHEHNIVHRDMKPENILFNSKGEALLADFGISTVLSTASIKLTEVKGTPSYMAPEQFRGQVSRRSDQYALACIMYELLCGRRPFGAGDFISLGFKHATEPPPPLRQFNTTIPVSIEQVVLRAMAKERNARFADIRAFLKALQSADRSQYELISSQEQQSTSLTSPLATNVLPPPVSPPPYQDVPFFSNPRTEQEPPPQVEKIVSASPAGEKRVQNIAEPTSPMPSQPSLPIVALPQSSTIFPLPSPSRQPAQARKPIGWVNGVIVGIILVVSLGCSAFSLSVFNPEYGWALVTESALALLLTLITGIGSTLVQSITSRLIMLFTAIMSLIAGATFAIAGSTDIQALLFNPISIASVYIGTFNLLFTGSLAIAAILSLYWLLCPFTKMQRIFLLLCFGLALACFLTQIGIPIDYITKHQLLLLGLIALELGALLATLLGRVQKEHK